MPVARARLLALSPPAELRPAHTLLNGQCFGWRPHEHRVDEYVGVLGRRVVSIRQTTSGTEFAAMHGRPEGLEEELIDYFQLRTPLSSLYAQWASAGCRRMEAISRSLPGLRILRQEPCECLFSFICSSNNNVPRITLILDRMRERYGERLCAKAALDSEATAEAEAEAEAEAAEPAELATGAPARNKLMPRMDISAHWHAFPPVEVLAAACESELRELGLGYRAKFVRNAAVKLVAAAEREGFESGAAYLLSLRSRPRPEVISALLALDGVGPKVADCVALFSLDQATGETETPPRRLRDASETPPRLLRGCTATPLHCLASVRSPLRKRHGPVHLPHASHRLRPPRAREAAFEPRRAPHEAALSGRRAAPRARAGGRDTGPLAQRRIGGTACRRLPLTLPGAASRVGSSPPR